ncbi:MAG: sporulation protein YqfD [Clostridia bacterium]|nr:sporulation protein YqfD [Clostridia bacterium]
MRKNKISNKGVVGVYTVYKITGVNLDRFINVVKRRGIDLYDIKKTSTKRLIVAVSYKDSANFFAIAKELCYNIKKVREKGKGYPLLRLMRSFGMVIGAVVFALTAFIADDTVFALSFSGSGSIYKREVLGYLNENGVKPWVRFSSLDLQKIEDGILAFSPHLSFVSCKKQGSRLNVELVLSQEKVETLDGNVYELVAQEDGIVEKLKVYRGTAQVEVGKEVKKGDVLVGGFAVIKEQTVKINVLATVSMLVNKTFTYRSEKDNDQSSALIFAQETLGEKEILSSSVNKIKDGEEFIYEVTALYRLVTVVG